MNEPLFRDLGGEKSAAEILNLIGGLVSQNNLEQARSQSVYLQNNPQVTEQMESVVIESKTLSDSIFKSLEAVPDSDQKTQAISTLYKVITDLKMPYYSDSIYFELYKSKILFRSLSECLSACISPDEIGIELKRSIDILNSLFDFLTLCERILEFNLKRVVINDEIEKFIILAKLPIFIQKINRLNLNLFMDYINFIQTRKTTLSPKEVEFLRSLAHETIIRNTIADQTGITEVNVNAVASLTEDIVRFGGLAEEKLDALQNNPNYEKEILDYMEEITDTQSLDQLINAKNSAAATDLIRLSEQFTDINDMVARGQQLFDPILKAHGIPDEAIQNAIKVMN